MVERLSKPGCYSYGLYQDTGLAGFIALMPAGSGECNAYEITRLAVSPEYRHNGFGKLLINTAVEKARELGASKVNIGIINDNAVLKNWYMAQGFIEVSKKEYPFLPFVVCEMELEISRGLHG